MPLGECLSKTTHRQYLVWMRWLEDQWNNPDRSDHYLMQLAAMQTRKAGIGDMKIKFGSALRETSMTAEEATAWSKARVHRMFGVDDRPQTMK